MLEQLKRPQLKAPEPRRPAPPPLKPATEPAMPMPSVFTRALEKPPQKKQRKACPACEEEGTTCPACQKKAAPTLERPPSQAHRRGGSPGADPAERQADDLGKDIGEELKGTENVGHGPLPKSVRDVAETHLGVSLEGTYVDSGSTGQKKAKDESALAVTEGKRIAFGEGQLSTASAEGRALLGHELVHVGQQSAERRMASQRQALSAQKDSAKGGAPPNSLKAVQAALASKPPDVVGALKILNGRSMAELLKWLRTLGPRAAWSIRSAAYSVGGPRLVAAIDIAIHGGYLGEVAVERLNAVVSTLPPDQRNAIVAFLRADGLQSWLLVLLVLPHKVVLSREKFLQANADLGVTLSRIDGAVLVGLAETPELLRRFYEYYSASEFVSFVLELHFQRLESDPTLRRAAETQPGGGATKLNPSEMAKLSNAGLVSVLMHEFMHTRHQGVPGVTPGPEGEAYGWEMAYTQHVGETARNSQVSAILGSGAGLAVGGEAADRWAAFVSQTVVAELYEIMAGRKPLIPPPSPISSDLARTLIANFVADPPSIWPSQLRSLHQAVWTYFHALQVKHMNPERDPITPRYHLPTYPDMSLFR